MSGPDNHVKCQSRKKHRGCELPCQAVPRRGWSPLAWRIGACLSSYGTASPPSTSTRRVSTAPCVPRA
eukprot:2391639-Rhodomonas_salina.2